MYCDASAELAKLIRRSALETGLSDLVASAEAESRRPLVACKGKLFRPKSYGIGAGTIDFKEGEVDVFTWQEGDVLSAMSRVAGARWSDGLLTLVDASGAALAQDENGAIIEFEENNDAD